MNLTSNTTLSPTCHTMPGRKGEGEIIPGLHSSSLSLATFPWAGTMLPCRNQRAFSAPEGSSCWEGWGWSSWEFLSHPPMDETGYLVPKTEDCKSQDRWIAAVNKVFKCPSFSSTQTFPFLLLSAHQVPLYSDTERQLQCQ